MRMIVLALSLLTFTPPSLLAQKTPTSTGTLSGHVICTDTNGPARFAKVMLTPVLPLKNFVEEPATVDQDGTYFFRAVLPGNYYVHALMPGYTDPLTAFSSEDFASTDPTTRALIANSTPVVTINSTEPTRMDLRIDRGASIAGRILYDDGTPAQNWGVFVQKPLKQGGPQWAAGYHLRGATDDLGRFRLSGLPAGEYVLVASYQDSMLHGYPGTMMPDHIAIVVFSGNTSFASKAQPITVTAGEERTGADITVPLHNLHRISGQVVAKADSRPVNDGSVSLSTVDNSAYVGSAVILPDSSFTIDFVPGNTTYTLKVDRAAELKLTPLANGTDMQSRHYYGPTSTQITLRDGDVDNIILAVPEPPTTAGPQ